MPKNTRRVDGAPETPADTRFFNLRQSGYRGWTDQDGHAAACPICNQKGCTRGLTEH